MGLDPVLSAIFRVGLAGLFGIAAVHKARDIPTFSATLNDYQIVPERWARGLSILLIGLEIATALALLFPPAGAVAGCAAAMLLSSYTAAIGLNLLRGRRHIDCGCLGPGRRQSISGWLVARNALLVGVALLAAVPPGNRTLGWVDALSLCGGLTAAVLVLAAASRLAAEAPTSQRLRRSV
jgi:hypothetical protein